MVVIFCNFKSRNMEKTKKKREAVTSAEIKFLCNTLNDIFDRIQISCSFFYGEKEDAKVLTRIYEIQKKNSKTP